MTPRVKDIIRLYKEGNIEKVEEYLFQPGMFVEAASWEGRIKKLIEDKLYNTAKCEIELVGYKFKNI